MSDEIAGPTPKPGQAVRRGTNPEMVRVAVAVLRNCNKTDRTAAIMTALEEMSVDLVKVVATALDKGKPSQFSSLIKAYNYVQRLHS